MRVCQVCEECTVCASPAPSQPSAQPLSPPRSPTAPQVKQYGVPNAKQFLAQHFPDGVALESAYVSPAVVGQVG